MNYYAISKTVNIQPSELGTKQHLFITRKLLPESKRYMDMRFD